MTLLEKPFSSTLQYLLSQEDLTLDHHFGDLDHVGGRMPTWYVGTMAWYTVVNVVDIFDNAQRCIARHCFVSFADVIASIGSHDEDYKTQA